MKSPIPYGHCRILYLAIGNNDFQNKSVAQEVWKSSFPFDVLALLPHWPVTSYSASTIQTWNSPQSNPVIYTFGLAPMCQLKNSHNEPALCLIHCRGLLVWWASTI